MLLINSPTPSICIIPASPEKIHPEPYSPIPSAKMDVEGDGYRVKWLSLPPSADTPPWHSSPLHPADCPPPKRLGQDQFDLLLKVSRDYRANPGIQKIPDLRKELASKNQKLKQFDRRARFMSKVKDLPCIVTTSIPEDSRESSKIARWISPRGFESDFSALEAAAEIPEDLVVFNSPINSERDGQVGHDLFITKRPLTSSKSPPAVPKRFKPIPPSLDEITARLKPVHKSFTKDCSQSRLPDFLKALSLPSGSAGDQIKTVPVRSLTLNDEKFDTTIAQQVIRSQIPNPCTLKPGSKRAVNLRAINIAAGYTLHIRRADTARDMIVTLKRRSSPPLVGHHVCTRIAAEAKRRSAPAELPQY